MNMKTLLAWIGNTDVYCARDNKKDDIGPIAQGLVQGDFERVFLVSDKTEADRSMVQNYLQDQVKREVDIIVKPVELESVINLREIYPLADSALNELIKQEEGSADNIYLHLSPGTPAMASVWVLLAAKTGAHLIQTSREHGYQGADIPIDIHAEYVPDLVKGQSQKINRAIVEPIDTGSGFDAILHQSKPMAKVVETAQKIAVYDIPVLIEGESGTGKELFARAIHENSERPGPYRAINCGAIPENLIDSELFGYEKGAFSGADKSRAGEFESAEGGTLFLDEIGELPLPAQTRLLRVLQEKVVRRVGPGSEEKSIDVRIVAATNKDLVEEIREGNFREDLYFRLAATTIYLPALRDRENDVEHLIDELFQRKCQDLGARKQLSVGAREQLRAHTWPGNVRELEWTLARAIVLGANEEIGPTDIKQAIKTIQVKRDDLLHRPIGKGFNIDNVLLEIEAGYVKKALDQTNQNLSAASGLLGIKPETLRARTKKQLSQYL
jgi:DNA-binding NtrC family response regulator